MNKDRKLTPPWEPVGDIDVVKLWKLEGPNTWPEIVIVRMSNAEYQKYSHDPNAFMDFANKNALFSKPAILAGPWVGLSYVDKHEPPPDDWILLAEHGKMSSLIVAALPKLVVENKKIKAK
jgi:hypothetical protein